MNRISYISYNFSQKKKGENLCPNSTLTSPPNRPCNAKFMSFGDALKKPHKNISLYLNNTYLDCY